MPYAELTCATAFSFLRAASRAEELTTRAAELGLAALGIADRNTVAGVVRAHEAAKAAGLRLLPGARIVLRDAAEIACYPQTRAAWGRLTTLLTHGKRRAPKGDCHLDFADLAAAAEGMIAINLSGPAACLREAFGDRAYAALHRRHLADDARRMRRIAAGPLPTVACNEVLYHTPERRPLLDAMTCIRLGTTITSAGQALSVNAERHLKPPAEMARLLKAHPDAIARTLEITDRCRFSLDELAYEYPNEPIPAGATPDGHLAALAREGLRARYPEGAPARVAAMVEKELAVIASLKYAPYFLTVHDIVRFARAQGILCQGRGSAANSAVCYVLGITAVDPAQSDLLFERFISAERQEPPDIDVDFEHERREEVIQYIYQRYGHDRAAIAATVIHYRPKMAAREIGKVMGLPEDVTAALSAQSWGSWHNQDALWPDERLLEIGLDPASPLVRRTIALARELVGFPRHLSQHVGGFILTRGPLIETVPIGPAAMENRFFIEWDKDDIDALGIMKVDILALGMLSCIRRAFALLTTRGIPVADLAAVPREDPATYDMLCRGDSVGVFQVESRAQMNMLPRLRPREFYDLVIEVAIVRPGPIQGDMVHPYLRRRQGRETVAFPSPAPEHGPPDELQRVLGRTLGVPLFQEQAMRIAIEAAKFTPGEANQLRRAMATFRNVGTIHTFFAKMVDGMTARGYERDFAERCFKQIEGFGTYGFPESHAASFAHLVYVSAWLKCHHPAAFACALLNAQPMGFYAPAQIVRDAREHGVAVRAPDVNSSDWDCTLEQGPTLRLGLRQITGFREDWAATIRARRPFPTPATLATLPRPALVALAEADALRSVGLDRRAALWFVQGLKPQSDLPLLANLPQDQLPTQLPPMRRSEHVAADYRATALSLKAHPLRFLRDTLAREGILPCAAANTARNGAAIAVAGVVLVRQRPGSAQGVVFATIEDETGIANLVIWPAVMETYRRAVLASRLLLCHGRLQRSQEGVVHLVAERLEDRTSLLAHLEAPPLARADELPVPPSRDFR